MEIPYSKDYDALIQKIYKEIRELELEKRREKDLYCKENKLTCDTCRYSWLSNVGDYHTSCERGMCKLCQNVACDDYAPTNEAAQYLIDNGHAYDDEEAYTFYGMFGGFMADSTVEKIKKFYELYKLREQIKE